MQALDWGLCFQEEKQDSDWDLYFGWRNVRHGLRPHFQLRMASFKLRLAFNYAFWIIKAWLFLTFSELIRGFIPLEGILIG